MPAHVVSAMAVNLEVPPVLSTPETHILNETTTLTASTQPTLPDEGLSTKYEIQRTLSEIKEHRWERIALQFPDEMLYDAPRVFQLLSRGLDPAKQSSRTPQNAQEQSLAEDASRLTLQDAEIKKKLFILADTSYGSCCVDEVAAEHVNADAVVHYGRACLSPTVRLPVLHVFTHTSLDISQVVSSFKEAIPEYDTRVVLTADIPYASHVPEINSRLIQEGYMNIFAAEIVHDPASPVPNRTVPDDVKANATKLQEWQIYHIAQPPTSLLLTLSSRVSKFHIFATGSRSAAQSTQTASTAMMLRRRYGLITSLATVPIWGILINTLSVKNYLHMVDHVRDLIAAAGKKSYLFVVGKLNAAKVANFGEIGGWVIIGCWESSLIDSHDFYKPVITPFELKLALSSDSDRVWTGQWRSDFQAILDESEVTAEKDESNHAGATSKDSETGDYDSEEESEPPEFDLRTGKYVSQSRPMRQKIQNSAKGGSASSTSALMRKAKGDLTINGTASPGAEFLRNKRTWQGLGSDFEVRYEDDGTNGSAIQEGQSGVARGYTVGDSGERH